MAELLLYPFDEDDGNGYESGDIVAALSDVTIGLTYAEQVVDVKGANTQRGKKRPADDIAIEYLSRVKEYRLEAINPREALVTRLSDGYQQTTGVRGWYDRGGLNRLGIPIDELPTRLRNGRTQFFVDYSGGDRLAMDVDAFSKTRINKHRHQTYTSENGYPMWFGGRTYWNETNIDEVWDKIEERTEYRRSSHSKWRWSPAILKKRLAITVTDLDQPTEHELVESLYDDPDENGHLPLLKKRKHNVNWKILSGLSDDHRQDVLNRNKKVDMRDEFSWPIGAIRRGKPF